ncbi:MAG: hypothetical protein ACK41E_01940 [Deinococcales bacterium]
MNIRDLAIGAGLALGVVALAQTVQRTLNVVVAGKSVAGKAVVVQNETYVSLKALSALGIRGSASGNTLTLSAATQGGANQVGAVEGCLGQDLFNGMLRLKVLAISRLETLPEWGNWKGWAIQIEAKNGTSERLQPQDMGLQMASIVRANGSLLAANGTGVETRDWDKLRYADLLPGASINHFIKFIDNDSAPDALPTKLVLDVDVAKVKPKINAKFNVKEPSFRIDLTCKK